MRENDEKLLEVLEIEDYFKNIYKTCKPDTLEIIRFPLWTYLHHVHTNTDSELNLNLVINELNSNTDLIYLSDGDHDVFEITYHGDNIEMLKKYFTMMSDVTERFTDLNAMPLKDRTLYMNNPYDVLYELSKGALADNEFIILAMWGSKYKLIPARLYTSFIGVDEIDGELKDIITLQFELING